jgi:hypothetical protein
VAEPSDAKMPLAMPSETIKTIQSRSQCFSQ